MSAPAAKISVWAGERFACVKLQGRANFTSSIDFKELVTQLQDRGFTFFVIELSECSLMDSTFLGVLAGIGLKLARSDGDPDGPRLELRNANARITELLENVGVLHLFKTSEGDLGSLEALEACAQRSAPASRAEVTEICLKAHKLLMEINPENVPRFKDVAKFLAEDLERLQAASPPPKS